MVNLILWLVFGALVGWLAGLVMNDREGTPLTIVIGIIGALLGGFLIGYSTISITAQSYHNVEGDMASRCEATNL